MNNMNAIKTLSENREGTLTQSFYKGITVILKCDKDIGFEEIHKNS